MSMELFGKTGLREPEITLHPYQNEAVEAVMSRFSAGDRSTLLVMATGLGKTATVAGVARKFVEGGHRVLFLAHRNELLSQAIQEFDQMGVYACLEQGDQRARALGEPDVVVSSIQTMTPKRLLSWDKDYFGLVIIDEAHHAPATSYKRSIGYFDSAKILGATATPERGDGEDLGQIFQSIAYEMNVYDGINAPPPGPYLCDYKVCPCNVDIDLRSINARGEDFTDAQLADRIGPSIEILANAIRQEAEQRKTLIFVPVIKIAQGMATAMQSMGLNAEWISGEDPDRDDKMKRYRKGEIQFLANSMLLTEGVNVPDISAVAFCRPTKSWKLFCQMAGRGLRIAEGKKYCRFIDFNYITADHDLVKPVHLMDRCNLDSIVLEIAQEMLDADKNLTMTRAIRKAKDEHKRRTILNIQARERAIKYRKVSYRPFDVYETLGLPWRGAKDQGSIKNKATPRVAAVLTKMGIDGAHEMSRSKAANLLDHLGQRRKLGKATFKQASWLIANGIDPDVARDMSFSDASAQLDRFFNKKRA
jgi:superfamily II DNA or RNA helicase